MLKNIADFIKEAENRGVDLKGLDNELSMLEQKINLDKDKQDFKITKLEKEIENLKEDKLINIDDDFSTRLSEISSLKKYNNSNAIVIMKDGGRQFYAGKLPGLIPVSNETFKRLQKLLE